MDKIVSLAKRRGFVFAGSEIYGGLANSWDYGPLGVELKNNIKKLWWDFFVLKRDNMHGIDAAVIMNRKVWQASGHEAGFSDPLADCKKCKNRFRPDKLENPKVCPMCGGELTEPRQFNTMMKTFVGPVEGEAGLMCFLIELRAEARKRKDFATSDAIRHRLTELGIALEDGKDGTTWKL